MKVCIVGVKGSISLIMMMGIYKSMISGEKVESLLTNTELFKDYSLVNINDMEFGGFDVRADDIVESAIAADHNDIFHVKYDQKLQDLLKKAQVYKGICVNKDSAMTDIIQDEKEAVRECSTLLQALEYIEKDLRLFKGNDDCVMINVASTESIITLSDNHKSLDNFKKALVNNASDITSGQLYAYAAIDAGIPYINFTPSVCADIQALEELSKIRKIPIAGKDGKTGETLLKTILSEMFSIRNLNIDMWYGTNILGNLDGKVLNYQDNKAAKITSKKAVLQKCIGYEPEQQVRIDYMKSMGDNKVAWDYVLFKGFGGAKMNMSFTWQGIDSFLAAPLVIDLLRLTYYAWKKGEYGLQSQFAVFFKTPLGTEENRLSKQYDILVEWIMNTK